MARTKADMLSKTVIPVLTICLLEKSGLVVTDPLGILGLVGDLSRCESSGTILLRPQDQAASEHGSYEIPLNDELLNTLQSSLQSSLAGFLTDASGSNKANRKPHLKSVSQLALFLSDLDVDSAQKSDQGTGGVYFIPDQEEGTFKVVFKPQSEENETSGGEGFLKEYAAYVLDDGLAGVPETSVTALDLGRGKGLQLGSAQLYLDDFEDAEDYGPGVFDKADIEKIGVLDIRLLNTDRHSANMMRHKKTGRLVPIDHGSAFPNLQELHKIHLEWTQYPSSKEPFSEEMLAKIEAIDVEADLEKLQLVGLDEGSLLGVWMATVMLQQAAKQGLTLFDVGSMIQRQGDRSEPSVLENLFHASSKAAPSEEFCDTFLNKLQEHLDGAAV